MGKLGTKIKLGGFKNDAFLRLDGKFRIFSDVNDFKVWDTKSTIPLSNALTYLNSKKEKKGELVNSKTLIDLSSITRGGNKLINLAQVDSIGSDKVILTSGEIVIPKLEPKKGQFFLNLNHKEYLGSTELIEYNVNLKDFNPVFLYYLLVSKPFLKALGNLESGKTHRRVNPSELVKIKIPDFSIEDQNRFADEIKPLQDDISELISSIGSQYNIINRVFASVFNIDLSKVNELDSESIFKLSLNKISYRNSNFRNSSRWFKIQQIQEFLYKEISCIEKLGVYISKTNNGWSPKSQEGGNGTPILGQEHFNANTNLNISPTKTTTETKNNIEDFYIKKGDFFVSRGNTIDLVALASIVKEDIEDDILYPDLYIKIEFKTSKIDKDYLAYLFNSFFGRLYFKYVSKGKNQTMVKISSIELDNFYIPIPTKNKQLEIVKKIKAEIDSQKLIEDEIEAKKNKINSIIEKAIELM